MEFPFYNNDTKAYTINDANFDCWRVIVADCPGSHRYATLCELIEDCPSVKQLTRPCIVEFLNDPTNETYTKGLDPNKWFVKVGVNGCLEIADPCICNDWDKYVIATDQDNNPWALNSKVKGSCSYDGLYCIDIEEGWPQTLVWRPSGPNGPFINPDLPTDVCDGEGGYYVRLVQKWSSWWVDYTCPEVSSKPQFAKCIYSWGLATTSCKDRTVRYYLPHRGCTVKPIDSWSIDNAEWYINGTWDIKGTPEAFDKPSSYGVINIKEPGVYALAFSTYITSSQTLHSIRCGLYADIEGSWPKELNDIKFQGWEYPFPWGEYWDPVVFNRLFPDQWDPAKFTRNYKRIWWTLENTWLPFSRAYIINVINTPVEIFMAVKPDMRDRDPRVEEENDKDDRYHIQVEGYSSDAYWAATTIEIVKLTEAVAKSRLVELNL